MPFHRQTLPNGLQLLGETNPSALAVAVGFFVRTGSRDETDELAGVSHFLEHMVFKGTERRSALEVNKDFDRIGADYNAFTSEENTVYHAAVLPEYLPDAIDVLADILRPSLRDDDFEMEKKVILEEIGMYEDQPMWSAYDHARKFFYGKHPLGNTVLGSTQSVGALTSAQMRAYFERRYVAPNIVAVAAGNYDWARFVDLVAARCGGWASGQPRRDHLREATPAGGLKVVTKEKVTQEHVILIAPAPPAESPLRYAADTLALAIGDDSGSRLYWELVDPGLADSADTSYHENEAAGCFYTSFSGDPEQAAENYAIVRRVLAEVQRNGLTEEELQQAKSKITSRLVRGNERTKSRMLALGAYWTYLKDFHQVDHELKAFDAVTLGSIREVQERYPIAEPTTLAFGPLTALNGTP